MATKKEADFPSVVLFVTTTINKSNTMIQHIDDQTNILIGISTAIFAFATVRVGSGADNWVYIPLGVFSALSALMGLFALHPPRFMRKKGQRQSLMFPSSIATYDSAERYIATIIESVKTEESVLEECAREIYNMSNYYYIPKRKLFRVARNLLLCGVVLGLAAFVLEVSFL